MSDPTQDPVPPQSQPPAYVPSVPAASTAGLSDNIAGALAYITIIPAIIFLVIEPYNKVPFVRFHSFQSIAFCLAAFVLDIAIMIAEGFLHVIPMSFLLFSAVNMLVGLALFVAWILVVIKAFQGQWYKLPIIGDFAEIQARS